MTDCPRCAELITPALVGACASVGIEHDKSTGEMMRDYLAQVHRARAPVNRLAALYAVNVAGWLLVAADVRRWRR